MYTPFPWLPGGGGGLKGSCPGGTLPPWPGGGPMGKEPGVVEFEQGKVHGQTQHVPPSHK